MVVSLILTYAFSIGLVPLNSSDQSFLKEEIVEYRERFSSSFLTDKGTVVSIYSGSPINYIKNGHYFPIDTSFKKENDCYLSNENDYTVTLIKDRVIVDDSIIFTNLLSENIEIKDNMLSCHDGNVYSLSDSMSFAKKILNKSHNYCSYNLSVELLNPFTLEQKDGLITFLNHETNYSFDLPSPLLFDDASIVCFTPFNVDVHKYADEKYKITYFYDVSKASSKSFSLNGRLLYPTGSYHDYPYIRNKYFQVGYSSTYTNNLTIGESPILDPYGNSPVYKTVYSLSLPTLPSNCHSLGACSFFFKRESGTQSLAGIYHITSYIDYDFIDGTSLLSTQFLGSKSISSSYSNVDIQKRVLEVYKNDNYNGVLNLLLTGMNSNKIAILNGTSSSDGPYFTIEYSTAFGTSRPYDYTYDGSLNCYSYVLFRSSIYQAEYYLGPYYGDEDLSNNNPLILSGLTSLLNFHCNSVIVINSHDELIPTTHRRIAIRLRYNNLNHFEDYHVMWQCNDGSWAAKLGPNNDFVHNMSIDAPLSEAEWGNGFYNTNTFYFAIISAI